MNKQNEEHSEVTEQLAHAVSAKEMATEFQLPDFMTEHAFHNINTDAEGVDEDHPPVPEVRLTLSPTHESWGMQFNEPNIWFSFTNKVYLDRDGRPRFLDKEFNDWAETPSEDETPVKSKQGIICMSGWRVHAIAAPHNHVSRKRVRSEEYGQRLEGMQPDIKHGILNGYIDLFDHDLTQQARGPRERGTEVWAGNVPRIIHEMQSYRLGESIRDVSVRDERGRPVFGFTGSRNLQAGTVDLSGLYFGKLEQKESTRRSRIYRMSLRSWHLMLTSYATFFLGRVDKATRARTAHDFRRTIAKPVNTTLRNQFRGVLNEALQKILGDDFQGDIEETVRYALENGIDQRLDDLGNTLRGSVCQVFYRTLDDNFFALSAREAFARYGVLIPAETHAEQDAEEARLEAELKRLRDKREAQAAAVERRRRRDERDAARRLAKKEAEAEVAAMAEAAIISDPVGDGEPQGEPAPVAEGEGEDNTPPEPETPVAEPLASQEVEGEASADDAASAGEAEGDEPEGESVEADSDEEGDAEGETQDAEPGSESDDVGKSPPEAGAPQEQEVGSQDDGDGIPDLDLDLPGAESVTLPSPSMEGGGEPAEGPRVTIADVPPLAEDKTATVPSPPPSGCTAAPVQLVEPLPQDEAADTSNFFTEDELADDESDEDDGCSDETEPEGGVESVEPSGVEEEEAPESDAPESEDTPPTEGGIEEEVADEKGEPEVDDEEDSEDETEPAGGIKEETETNNSGDEE